MARHLSLLLSLACALGCGSSNTSSVGAGEADSGTPRDDGQSRDVPTPTADTGAPLETDAGALDATKTAPDASVTTGLLVGGTGPYPGGMRGVHFRTASQNGFTSTSGAFTYLPGETVTFSVGNVDFSPTPGAPYVSPWQLVTAKTCAPSAELENLLVFLYSLDIDRDPADGTQIPQVAPGTTQQSFSTLSTANIEALVAQLLPSSFDAGVSFDAGAAAQDAGTPSEGGLTSLDASRLSPEGGDAALEGGPTVLDGGTVIVGAREAMVEFITQMDNEVWEQVSKDTFTGTGALYRSQGSATDGTNFYFSWQYGFDKTTLTYTSIEHNTEAIPASLVLQYDDHIGDFDYWDGHLYSGVEDDGTGEPQSYRHPHIAEFDTSHNYNQSWALSDTLMTAGVPWVAVDGPNNHFIIANWDPTPALFLLDLSTATYLSSIPLSQTLHEIQGAKLFEGSLYTSAYDTPMTIAKIDMATGVVIVLWHMTDAAYALPDGAEEEGCVFLSMADGSLFHTINNVQKQLSVEMRHHKRTRDPLRKSVCQ